MKQIIDFLPIVAFFGVYLVADIYTATIALMAAAALQIAIFKLKGWSIAGQMWVVFWGAVIFGAMTLAFRDPLFIQWKPTIVYWIMAVVIVGSRFVGRGDHVQRALGKVLTLPDRAWRTLAWGWSLAMVAAGVANLYVAYQFSETAWVTYKFVSAFALPVLLTILSVVYLSASGQLPSQGEAPPTADGEENQDSTTIGEANAANASPPR